MEEYEEVESALNSNVVYRRPKQIDSIPSSNSSLNEKRLTTDKSTQPTKANREQLNLDLSKATNYPSKLSPNLQPETDTKSNKKSFRNSPEPAQTPSPLKKSKTKSKKGKDVCATEIGPAIAAGINIGASILTTNGTPTGPSAPNTPKIMKSPKSNHADNDSSEDDSSDSDYEETYNESKEFVEIPQCPVPHDQGKETVNTIIPCSVDQLFTMIFTKSKFYLDLHTSRKTFDIVQAEWEKSAEGPQKTRTVTFTVTLSNLMGPKHSFVTENQTLLPVSVPGVMYAVDSETLNAGIPYADSFYVTTHFCLSRESANESKLVIVNNIKFRKSVFGVKGFIEKNSWEGITDFYTHLARALKEECSKSDFIRESPQRSADGVSSRRHNRIRKGPAPAVPETPYNGNISSTTNGAMGMSHMKSSDSCEGSLVLKVLLSVLAGLLILNAFLFVKLGHLETMANSPAAMFPHPLVLPKEIPQTHHEWLLLLQHQETLHRMELQKWHEILTAALQILNQAETGLESLKSHISSSVLQGFKNAEKESPKAKVSLVNEIKNNIQSFADLAKGNDSISYKPTVTAPRKKSP